MSPDYEAMMEEAAVDQIVHPELYEDNIDLAADDFMERQERRTVIVNDNDNPWE